MTTNKKIKHEIEYFFAGIGTETGRVVSAETTCKMHDEYNDVSREIR